MKRGVRIIATPFFLVPDSKVGSIVDRIKPHIIRAGKRRECMFKTPLSLPSVLLAWSASHSVFCLPQDVVEPLRNLEN